MSLRARTTVLVAVVTAALLVGGAVALDVVLRHRLTASADDLARSRVSDLLALAEAGDLPETLVNVTDDSVAQVVADGGRVVAASPNIEGAPPLTDEPATGGLRVEDVTGPDDAETEDYRLWTSTGPGGRRRAGTGLRGHQPGVGPRGHRRACARGCGSAYRSSGCSSWRPPGCWSAAPCAASTGSARRSTPSPRTTCPVGSGTRTAATRSAGSPPP